MNGGELTGSNHSAVLVGESAAGTAGNFTMNGGAIHSNTIIGSGSGVNVCHGSFTMNGGKINDNTAAQSGAGVLVQATGSFTMTGGEIKLNNATGGDGVYIESGGTFNMSGGEISGNGSAAGGSAEGIGMPSSASSVTLNMSGNAYVAANNFIRLGAGNKINITGNLTGAPPVAYLIPPGYTAGVPVLEAAAGVSTNNYAKFAVKPDATGNWTIDDSGCLQQQ
jgi:hypothetical protein